MKYTKQLSRLIPRQAPLSAAIATISLSFAGPAALADHHANKAGEEAQQHQAADTTSMETSGTMEQSRSEQSSSAQSDSAQAVQALVEQESSLETFSKALQESGIADGLAKGQKYTVFAPTNEAFESSDRSAEELLKPENRTELVELLRAHIVADDVDMDMARQISEARTIDGGTVKLSMEDDTLQVGDASVVQSSVQEGMLRVYPIDALLEPQPGARTASSGSSATGQSSQQPADFDELDQNSDGYLSEQEIASAEAIEQADTQQMDTNDDGQVSRTEFSAFEQKRNGSSSTESAWSGHSGSDESDDQ